MGQILIKNGRVWDGERFFFADILTDGPIITQIGPNLTCENAWVYDATGMIVSAGLVDCHMHIRGLSGDSYAVGADIACLPCGVTAAIDAGSRLGGASTPDSFTVKTLLFSDTVVRNDRLQWDVTAQRLTGYDTRAIGIKLFFDDTSKNVDTAAPLEDACAFAREKGVKLLVHCNHSPIPMAEIVRLLAPGDILTHIFHGGKHPCTEEDFSALKLAREKGVVLDAGFAGSTHADFGIMGQTIAAGFLPDTLSTDVTCNSAFRRGGRYGLTMCMGMARAAGMEEDAVFRAVTTAPAAAHGTDWGRLQISGPADIAVLDPNGDGFSITDKSGNTLQSPTGYRCKLTLANGQVAFRD